MEQAFKEAQLALRAEICTTLRLPYPHIRRTTPPEKRVFNLYYYSKEAPWETIKARINHTWNWRGISGNPNITWDIVKALPNKPWDRYLLIGNPAIYALSKPAFVTRWHAANVIKRAWFKCNTDPTYVVCRARLVADFDLLKQNHI